MGSPLIFVLGHTNCGAVTAATEGGEAEGKIQAIVDEIEPSVQKAKDAGAEDVLSKAIEYNVMNSINKITSSGITKEFVTNQIRNDFDGLAPNQAEQVIIAYEPIWAIGTGKTASSEDANEAICWIRDEIRNIYGDSIADNIIIQYGGSVKSSNAKELFAMSDIDGGLVGGASLDPVEFSKIVKYND